MSMRGRGAVALLGLAAISCGSTEPTGSGGAGGAAGAGVAGGAGGAPVVVGTCSGLGAPGTWEEISPIKGDTTPTGREGEGTKWGAAAVVLHPAQAGVVYAAVTKAGVWRSGDCGATWTKTDTGRNAAALDSGTAFSLALAPLGPDTIYASNFNGNVLAFLRSSNGGLDWDPLYGKDSVVATGVDYGGYGAALSVDPASGYQHILVTFHAKCRPPSNGGCLGESQDGGQTWRLVNGPLDDWAEAAGAYFLSATTWLHGSHQGLYYTADSGAHWEKVAAGGSVGGLYRAQDGTLYMGSDGGVLASRDGHAWAPLPGSPQAGCLVGTGRTLYAGNLFSQGADVLWSAPESDPTKWTRVKTPVMGVNGGPWALGYDAQHHVLYSANHRSGLWRMVAP